MKVCVVIPAHNESRTIAGLIEGVRKKGLDVVVIDDGSQDGTGNIAQKTGATVLVNLQKQGKGRSLQRGFQFVQDNDYDGLVVMDGDGQHAVEDLDNFLAKITDRPVSIITGTRMSDSRGMPLIRYLTNKLMSSLISGVCRQVVPDTQCGYRYISCEVLKDICITSQDFEIETEVLIKASKKGYQIFSVPIQTIYRNEKSKINPLKDTARFFTYLIRECFTSQR